MNRQQRRTAKVPKIRRAAPGEMVGKDEVKLQVASYLSVGTRDFFSNWDDDARDFIVNKLVDGTLELLAGLDNPASYMTMVGDEQVYMTRKVCGQPPDTTTTLTSYNPMTQAFVIYLETELKPATIN
jgi:hypothetical protein